MSLLVEDRLSGQSNIVPNKGTLKFDLRPQRG